MAETLLRPGDELTATVTATKPFGVFVRSDSGIDGLVRGARAEVGASIRIRVIEFDDVEHRFSATAV
ncbi:S1 RNA-binding domain-containing protein [Microbacterium sp. B2969]|uniref:S1 RNA-binding domain-containing protein n=1 Tax=Microbacterium alkaliflavum TaxID=3248839 RepID=A0ABW7QAX1_9MICO